MRNTSENLPEKTDVKNFKPCQQCGVGTGTSRRLVTHEFNRDGKRYSEKKWEWVYHMEPCLYDWNYQTSEAGKRIVKTKLVCSRCFLKLARQKISTIIDYGHHKVTERKPVIVVPEE